MIDYKQFSSTPKPVPFAIVHHANQYLITDGYQNREGITQLVEGYTKILKLHQNYCIPLSLHLSGTLIESIAWHCPWFLTMVRVLKQEGLVSLIGGTYADNVMTLFPPSYNMRQLNELLWLYRRHLECEPTEIKVCWIPERVWDTRKLAPTLTSTELPNGGYRFVILDERLLYQTNGSYQRSARALIDASGLYPIKTPIVQEGVLSSPSIDTYRVYSIRNGNGLGVLPICANLRYCVPPWYPEHWSKLSEMLYRLSQYKRDDIVLVYGDDLEKTAGVGPWFADNLRRYEAFLQWLKEQDATNPILLTEWLDNHPPGQELEIDKGTFFELAQLWRAGEDYLGWWENSAWLSYRHYLTSSYKAVQLAQQEGVDSRLLNLAWKHLLASGYETAWHEVTDDGPIPSHWARALACHARANSVVLAAARWFARTERRPSAQIIDIDGDGEYEVVLQNNQLFAVVAPHRGGRLVYLFSLTPQGGALVIGNPTDDWNWQEELNRYMDHPPNHPGALADLGFEHDSYEVSVLECDDTHVFMQMVNVQGKSPMYGTRKGLLLTADAPFITFCGRFAGEDGVATEFCLSPDYYHLLREGRECVSPITGKKLRGFHNGHVGIWVAQPHDESTFWEEPTRAEVGHGLNLRVRTQCSHFHLLIGCNIPDEERIQEFLRRSREVFHEMITVTSKEVLF